MKRLLLIAVIGCGSDPVTEARPDAQAPVDSSVIVDASVPDTADAAPEIFPAFTPDLPTVVSLGGPTLKDPIVVPIFFADEDPAKVTKVMDFLSKLPGSSYWSQTTTEYGVASIKIAPAVSLVEKAPASITNVQIEAWLTDAIATSKVPPNQTQKTIYTLYYPQTTTVINGGLVSCVDFGGYHGEASGAVYAEINGCASYSARLTPGEVITGIDVTTGLTTHELIEAVTDPFFNTQPAYKNIDGKHHAWSVCLNGAEVGDTCELEPNAFYKDATLGYVVQRAWSNQNAAAGHDPCVPVAGTPWVAAFPVSGPLGVKMVNGTVTIPIHLLSDGPTTAFTVKAIDYTSERGKPAELSLSLDKSSGKNGDTLQLTVKLISVDPTKYEGYILETELGGVRRRTAGLVY